MSFANVSEISPLYDSVIVSQRLWGNEINVKGWFGGHANAPWARPLEQFGRTHTHIFFKDRTEGNSNLSYCNLQSAESMDFGYRLYSIGVRFWGPASAFEVMPRVAGESVGGLGMYPWGALYDDANGNPIDDPYVLSSCLAHWWKTELPYHCSLEFSVEQDTICEGPAYTFPPGHGIIGAGSSWSDPVSPGQATLINGGAYNQNIDADVSGEDSLVQSPQMISAVNQGVPRLSNRFLFQDSMGRAQPIEIPRRALFEAKIKLSPYAQYFLEGVMGPLYYHFNRTCPREWATEGPVVNTSAAYYFGMRYGITVSLLGERLVQQRGQYHAPGTALAKDLAE